MSTKIHATCDALGNRNPTASHLTPGQAHDLEGADVLIDQIEAEALLADKAYDADERVRNKLKAKNCTAIIPCKSTRKQPHTFDRIKYPSTPSYREFFCKTEAI